MSDALARSRKITRRTFGAAALAVIGGALAHWGLPSLGAAGGLDSLAALPEAAALKALGVRPDVAALGDVTARLEAKLDGVAYAEAVAQDRAGATVIAVDGWMLPETQVLAARWLAAQG